MPSTLPRMRIGICAYWFNRGQGVVARQLRSAIDALGHETFVLARPTRAKNIRPAFIDRTGVWDQPGSPRLRRTGSPPTSSSPGGARTSSTSPSSTRTTSSSAIAELRDAGVRTVGRFVWEQFSSEHVEPARAGPRRRLLADRRRARALPRRSGSRARGCAGGSTRSCSRRLASRRTSARPGRRAVLLSRRLPEQAQAAGRDAEGVPQGRRRRRAPDRQGPGRARGRDARARRPRATRGSR